MPEDASPETSVLRVGDDRQLAYIRSPRPGSRHVLFLHGTPGSRLFRPPDPMLPAGLDIDLVTVDRPGYGRSTRLPHRTLLDWPADAAALADHLGWGRFRVMGISGGGPFALACAHRLPERVSAVTLISSVAPHWPGALRGMLRTTRWGFQLANAAPWLLYLAARRTAHHPDRFLSGLRHELPEPDRRILARPDVATVVADNSAESLAGGEAAREMVMLRRKWGFTPADVAVPVRLWHGESDRNVPVSHGHRLADMLPNCRPTFVPEAGHYFIFDHWPDVLADAADSP